MNARFAFTTGLSDKRTTPEKSTPQLMQIYIAHLDRRTDFESLRDSLSACRIDISSVKVVRLHSDTPGTASESSVVAAVRDVYRGCPLSEGHLQIYAEKVLRGGVIVRLDLHDDRQFDTVQNLVRGVLLNNE